MNRFFAILAILLLLAITVLSVVPPHYRTTTPLPHKLEHGVVFALAGFAFGLGFAMRLSVQVAVLVAFAAAIELVQLGIPGRHARLSDFIVDAVGCGLGAALASALARGTAAGRGNAQSGDKA